MELATAKLRALAVRLAAKLGLTCLMGLLAHCATTPKPVLTGAIPSVLVQGEETTVQVSGHHLSNALTLDLDTARPAVLNRTWQLQIGGLAVAPERIQLRDAQTLSVTVPRTLPLGMYDLLVVTPAGMRVTLSPGLTVIARDTVAVPPSEGDAALGDVPSAEATQTSPAQPQDASVPLAPAASASSNPTSIASASPSPGEDASDPDPLHAALVHRYSFEQAGDVVIDSVAGADGTFIGGRLDGMSGAAALMGPAQYVDLPNGLVSVYDAVTVEVWLIWDAPDSGPAHSWQRIFDFGSGDAPEGQQGTQDTHLFLTPRAGGPAGTLHLAYRGDLIGSVTLNASAPLPIRVLQHLAAVVDGVNGQMAIYQEGALVASRALDFPLSSIKDYNCWLGRSQLADDPAFQGRIFELRIYDRALTVESLSASYAAGPDVGL